MTTLIGIAVPLAGLLFWILRWWIKSHYGIPGQIIKLKGKADALASEIIREEKKKARCPSYDAGMRVANLHTELSSVNRKIRALRENQSKGFFR